MPAPTVPPPTTTLCASILSPLSAPGSSSQPGLIESDNLVICPIPYLRLGMSPIIQVSLARRGGSQLSRYYMALRSAASSLSSRSQPANGTESYRSVLALIWAGFLTLVVAGPWLLPGYLFGTDWPGPRHFVLPTTLESSALVQIGLAALAWAIGAETTGKFLVLGSLFAAAALAYTTLPRGEFVPRAAAATLYVVNPFVYSRLHYGQLFLIGAFAVLPWAVWQFRLLLVGPRPRTALLTATAFALTGIFSPHVLVIASL